LAGTDRYGTAVAVAQYAFPSGAPAVFLATGLNFPDALAGVPAAASQRAPILLTSSGLPAGVITELGRLDPDTAYLLGGSAAVTVRVAKETQRTLGICWSGFKPPAGSSQVYTLLPATKQIALTFDMGGRLDPAVQIMQFLVDNQVCATIFPTGASAQSTIGRQVMAVIKAHPELFEVGNHTYLHCNLRDGGGPVGCPATPPTADFIRSQLTSAETVVRNLTGEASPPFWRPPYGAYNDFVRSAAASVGYTKTVMWHVDTIDWDPGTTTDEILSRVLGKATSGSIVLMHLGGYHTLDALPSLVAQLRARGYTLTSISDMLD
jgi:peptidoglycan/xylan/chitin deacetylase (PgdA/CDA1 family)